MKPVRHRGSYSVPSRPDAKCLPHVCEPLEGDKGSLLIPYISSSDRVPSAFKARPPRKIADGSTSYSFNPGERPSALITLASDDTLTVDCSAGNPLEFKTKLAVNGTSVVNIIGTSGAESFELEGSFSARFSIGGELGVSIDGAGGDGNDTLVGGPGSDYLFSGSGSDDLGAQDGEVDTLDGGSGSFDTAYVDNDMFNWVLDEDLNIETIFY